MRVKLVNAYLNSEGETAAIQNHTRFDLLQLLEMRIQLLRIEKSRLSSKLGHCPARLRWGFPKRDMPRNDTKDTLVERCFDVKLGA
jgi:hypothetical protein